MLKQLFGILAAVALAAQAEDVIRDETYNLPPAIAANSMGVDAAMKQMETAVAPEVLKAFKEANPARFWLFGEDRQLAVRNGIVPAHWFDGWWPGNEVKQHGKFYGIARPGEFYVFQVCVLGGAESLWIADAKPQLNLKGAEIKWISRNMDYERFEAGKLKPLWLGIQIPQDAKPGTYQGTVEIGASKDSINIPCGPATGDYAVKTTVCKVSLKIEGEPVAESGTGDAWRLARLKWLDSKIGQSDTEVTRPFTPIVVDEKARTLDILGRRITLGENGIPAQYTSFFSGSNTSNTGDRLAGAWPRSEENHPVGTCLGQVPAGSRFCRRCADPGQARQRLAADRR